MVDTLLLWFSQLNGDVKIDLRNVIFDAKARCGIIFKAEIEQERSVWFQNLYGSGSSRVMGMEYHEVGMWWSSHVETRAPFYSAHGHESIAKEDGVDEYALFVCDGKEKMRRETRLCVSFGLRR